MSSGNSIEKIHKVIDACTTAARHFLFINNEEQIPLNFRFLMPDGTMEHVSEQSLLGLSKGAVEALVGSIAERLKPIAVFQICEAKNPDDIDIFCVSASYSVDGSPAYTSLVIPIIKNDDGFRTLKDGMGERISNFGLASQPAFHFAPKTFTSINSGEDK